MSALGSFDATMRFRRMLSGLPRMLDGIGEQGLFYGESLRYIPNALTRYRRETIRLIAEMAMGSGALAIIGGTGGYANAHGQMSLHARDAQGTAYDFVYQLE